jgi:hypothetical protein
VNLNTKNILANKKANVFAIIPFGKLGEEKKPCSTFSITTHSSAILKENW